MALQRIRPVAGRISGLRLEDVASWPWAMNFEPIERGPRCDSSPLSLENGHHRASAEASEVRRGLRKRRSTVASFLGLGLGVGHGSTRWAADPKVLKRAGTQTLVHAATPSPSERNARIALRCWSWLMISVAASGETHALTV